MMHQLQTRTTPPAITARLIAAAVHIALGLHLALVLLAPASAIGQEKKEDDNKPPVYDGPLTDYDPFDKMWLPDKNGKQQEVFLEPMARRPQPGQTYSVMVTWPKSEVPERQIKWENRPDYIYKSYADMVMEQAGDFMKQENFAGAYQNYLYLRVNYPGTPGLDAALLNYLFQEGKRVVDNMQYDEALLVFEELYRINPTYKPEASRGDVRQILTFVIARVAEQYFTNGKYQVLRAFLKRIKDDYKAEQTVVIDQYNGKMDQLAKEKLAESRQLLKEGKFIEARNASRQMLRIWPTVEGGAQLLADIGKSYRLIVVGVDQRPGAPDPRHLTDWAARRVGRLTRRSLTEFTGFGPAGGQYRSPLGEIEHDPELRTLTFTLRRTTSKVDGPSTTAQPLSRRLLQFANPQQPDYIPGWARLLKSVETEGSSVVRAHFSQPHVLPQSWLQTAITREVASGGPETADGPYRIIENNEKHLQFGPNPEYGDTSRPKILEVRQTSSRDAFKLLERGDIDVLDRVFPADAARFVSRGIHSSSVKLGRYEMPTVHFLLPNKESPFMKSRTFRRAMVYGIDRERILTQTLLGDRQLTGCRTVTGPFPAPYYGNEPVGYAYNERPAPRTYEPRLATTLVKLAETEQIGLAKIRKTDPPKLKPLLLYHPANEVATLACKDIAEQLESIGVKVNNKPLPDGQTMPPDENYDLLYVEAAVWEPVTDARRVLAAEGLLKQPGPYINLGLRRLDAAEDWDQTRARLYDLHQLSYADVAIVPLWQMVDYYGYHKAVSGLGERQISLYDTVEKWEVSAFTP